MRSVFEPPSSLRRAQRLARLARATRALRCSALAALLTASLVALLSCGAPTPSAPNVGTNSNWLKLCVDDGECGSETSCQCGACTTSCNDTSVCAGLADARCAASTDPAAWAQCGSRNPSLSAGLCLPRCAPGECGADQACVEGACVLATLPDVELCREVTDRDPADRAREDELLALVQALRADGGVSCVAGATGSPPSTPAPPLRLDPRLLCTARVLAADLAQTHARSLTDSAGRTSQDRLAAVRYTAQAWGESFAIMIDSPASALDAMLADADSCARLTDSAFTEVGIGSAGDAMALSIGQP